MGAAGVVKGRVAGLCAMAVIALAGCGSAASSHLAAPTPSLCPNPGECPGNDPQANIRANNAYRDYQSIAPAAKEAADPLVPEVRTALARIRAHPPVTEASVRAVLLEAFPTLRVDVSALAARIREGIGYSVQVFVDNAVGCVHGWVSDRAQAIAVTGPTTGEGCLPLLGH
jgi:hypothetical protein